MDLIETGKAIARLSILKLEFILVAKGLVKMGFLVCCLSEYIAN